ncbi:MAG: hypothetical protein UU10_C0007G0002 [Parcubacteria group bacterium GW2011_GWF1_40_6]|nr:MAG: hypothetical protein UU10_C0007G0002 [Parcubacteria group bacterium GW2011_GWF1_40_6]
MKLNSKHTEETKKKMSLARLGVEPINKGKKGIISEETRKKMSLAKLGKRSRRIGFKASKETLIKLRESHLGQKAWNKGKKGLQVAWNKGIKGLHLSPSTEFKKGIVPWNWRGITPINERIRKSLEYKLWRMAVFERDNYTCVWCGAKNGNGKSVVLNADHIKPFAFYPELRFAIDNGRTLCVDCHKTTNTWGRPKGKYKK